MSFENDKLNRKKYADYLTEIISNVTKYKKISDSESMSIAIDSGWGTGKTTFINMWKEELENQKDANGKEKFAVITYNAWKNDFLEEPLESLIYTIINHDIFNKDNKIDGGKEAGNEVKECMTNLGIHAVTYLAKSKLGDAAGEAIGAFLTEGKEGIEKVWNTDDSKYEKFCEQYKEYHKAITNLKESLEKVTSQRQLIVIIDELDRCKPLFAIKLLENIKHILDVKNVTFVFALDMEQLSHSIKCIYGQGMDASGYLCRFFDYISKMPKPDRKTYIQYIMQERPLIRETLLKVERNTAGNTVYMLDIFNDFSTIMNLSLRDINTIYSSFLLLENNQLKNTDCYMAYELYLFLLILKYKRMDLFNKIFLDKDREAINDEIFKKFQQSNYILKAPINEILISDKICEKSFYIKNIYSPFSTKIDQIDERKIEYIDGGRYLFEYSSEISLSDCLFYDDLQKWNEIKDKELLTYIEQNLEFFDFEFEQKSQIPTVPPTVLT